MKLAMFAPSVPHCGVAAALSGVLVKQRSVVFVNP